MDFVTRLPKTRKRNNASWEIVGRLTKSAHFLPFREGMPLYRSAALFIKETIQLL